MPRLTRLLHLRILWSCLFLLATLHTVAAGAQELQLSLGQTLHLALQNSPELEPGKENVHQFERAEQQPNPIVNSAPRLNLTAGVRDMDGTRRPELGIGISQAFSLSGYTEQRAALGQAGTRLARAQLSEQKLSVLLEAARHWVRLKQSEEQLALDRRREQREQRLYSVVNGRFAIGAATAADAQLAKAHLDRAKSQLQQSLLERQATQHELSLLLDLSPKQLVLTHGDLPAGVASPRLDPSPTPHPQVLSARARANYLDKQADLQTAQGAPQVSVSAQLLREGSGDVLAVGYLSIPWPFINSNSYQAAQQRAPAESLRTRARHLEERRRLRTDFLQQHIKQLENIRTQISHSELQATESAMTVIEAQYAAGKVPIMTLLNASSALTDVQQRLLNAHFALRLSQLDLAFENNQLDRWEETSP